MNFLTKLPKELDELNKKVEKLYFKGKKDLLEKRKIAIVGSRRTSSYSRNITTEIALKLSKAGVCIVSGAAMGIDAIAHKMAFPNTIAVLGNSLDIIYPKVNETLIKEMMEEALVLSEYKEGFKATKYSFVHRNRIVVALSEAVIIPQGALNSGSMVSAKIALELKKDLYVLPQRIGESDGTNWLLKEGKAKLIDNIDDFVSKFKIFKEENDEILKFCKNNSNLEVCEKKFGSLIYEYELDGKISICGNTITVLV